MLNAKFPHRRKISACVCHFWYLTIFVLLFHKDINGLPAALEVPLPTGPFRNVGLSRAARTHKLRKLRTPSKCRECNSYVYFQGAECDEVSSGITQKIYIITQKGGQERLQSWVIHLPSKAYLCRLNCFKIKIQNAYQGISR